MSAPRESALAAVGATLLLALLTGEWASAVLPGLAGGGVWALMRLRGVGVVGSALAASGYATSATFLVGPLPTGVVAAALPWALAALPGAAPGAGHLLLAALGLALVGPRAEGGGAPDLVAAGLLFGLAGAGLLLRRAGLRELALLLVLALAVLLLRRGPTSGWSLGFAPGSWASAFAPLPDAPVRVWVAAPLLLLAGSSLFRAGGAPRGALLAGTLLALGLGLGLPGLADTWRSIPLLGEAAPVSLAPLAALGIALIAGETFEATTARQRAMVLALAVPLAVLAPADPPPQPGVGLPAEQAGLAQPLPVQPGGVVDLEGWVQGDLPGGALTIGLCSAGEVYELPASLDRAEDGKVAHFRLVEPLDTRPLPMGVWSVEARFEARGGASMRPLGRFLAGQPRRQGRDLGAWILAGLVLLAPASGRWRWLALGAVVAHAWLVSALFLAPAIPV